MTWEDYLDGCSLVLIVQWADGCSLVLLVQWAELMAVISREVAYRRWKKMDVGGNGGGLAINNKQRAMLPNKSRGEFIRNQRKDSEVSR